VTADPHALLRDGLRSMPQARELDPDADVDRLATATLARAPPLAPR
jgi:hypothetical protein